INSTGKATILSGGKTIGMTVSSGGIQHVSSGGVASSSIVKTGATIRISAGGKAIGGNMAGTQAIEAGGVASSITVYGKQNIVGSAYSAKILKGATQTIYKSGYAQTTTVSSGGKMVISGGGKSYKTTVKAGGLMVLQSGALANTVTMSQGGRLFVQGAARLCGGITVKGATVSGASLSNAAILGSGAVMTLTGTNTMTNFHLRTESGAVLSASAVGHRFGSLSGNYGAVLGFDLRSVDVKSSTAMLSGVQTGQYDGRISLHITDYQKVGTYELTDNIRMLSGSNVSVQMDCKGGSEGLSLSLNSGAKSYDGMLYQLTTSGSKVNLTISVDESRVTYLLGTQYDNVYYGTSGCDLFINGTGNETLRGGGGGRDVAVYGSEYWGQDTIDAGCGSVLIRGLRESDITLRQSGSDLIISKKSDSWQSIRVVDYDPLRQNIVYAGSMPNFDACLAAASNGVYPTESQIDAAFREVGRQTGLLAG
ncbi:MAG: AIDA repeat-containing protein, partial [Mailhella sp.]|nr:AIDA repeat-containing protein [Mailhella sp.]